MKIHNKKIENLKNSQNTDIWLLANIKSFDFSISSCKFSNNLGSKRYC